jgi:hypothetical protein
VLDGYLERHLAAAAERRVLESLDEVVEVDCDALEAGQIVYILTPVPPACVKRVLPANVDTKAHVLFEQRVDALPGLGSSWAQNFRATQIYIASSRRD